MEWVIRTSINGKVTVETLNVQTDDNIVYVNNYITTTLYIILVSWTFSAIGVIVGVFAKSWDHIGVFTTFIFMPLTMLGGVFWKVTWLPPLWSLISKFNPVYWMVNGLRQSMLGIQETSSPAVSLIIQKYKNPIKVNSNDQVLLRIFDGFGRAGNYIKL